MEQIAFYFGLPVHLRCQALIKETVVRVEKLAVVLVVFRFEGEEQLVERVVVLAALERLLLLRALWVRGFDLLVQIQIIEPHTLPVPVLDSHVVLLVLAKTVTVLLIVLDHKHVKEKLSLAKITNGFHRSICDLFAILRSFLAFFQ